MRQFTTNPAQIDPYRHFRFKAKWDGQVVPGVSRISPLRRVTEVKEFREGSDLGTARKLPGATKFEPLMLERGISHDTAFEQWANKSLDAVAGAGHDPRKDMRIELHNEAGLLVLAYKVVRCWVSEYQALRRSMPMPTPWPSSTSSSRTSVGCGNRGLPSSRPISDRRDV